LRWVNDAGERRAVKKREEGAGGVTCKPQTKTSTRQKNHMKKNGLGGKDFGWPRTQGNLTWSRGLSLADKHCGEFGTKDYRSIGNKRHRRCPSRGVGENTT